MKPPLRLIALSLLVGCASVELSDPVVPGCGDGVLGALEDCDEGDANSDTAVDACRSDCTLPSCGDGVTDADEACDDADPFGGDGCTPWCTVEAGQLETEPNDSPAEAETLEGDTLHGSLDTGDVDCVEVALSDCEALVAQLVAPCPQAAVLTMADPDEVVTAVSTLDDDGCAVLTPDIAPGAGSVLEGTYSVCVEGQLDGAVDSYALELEVLAAGEGDYPVNDDLDGDRQDDRCDLDIDGDGIDNEDDACPETPNDGSVVTFQPQESGFLTDWLVAGPFEGLTSDNSCEPTADNLVAEADADAEPELATEAGTSVWRLLRASTTRVDLSPWATVDAPREAYLALYIVSEEERELTLALGPDDGAIAWLNGEIVQTIDGCQGTVVDQYTEEVTLVAGVNRLMLKIYDQGGGWGTYVRLLDADDEPVTDLEISMAPDGAWTPDETDSDGDGLPDICDEEPLDPDA